MATGGGFNLLEESMSVLGIPVMTKKAFVHTEHIIGKWWWDQLEDSMKQAGIEEPYNKGITIKEFQPSLLLLMQDGASKHTNIHTMLYLH